VWKDGENVLLLDGRQRRKNTIEANRRKAEKPEGTDKLPILLPVRVFKGTLEEAAELMETLNALRRDDSPMVRARRVLRMQKTGRSTEEIAQLLGKTKQTIEHWLALHDCSAKVQKAVEAGEMTLTAAVKLTSLPRKEQDQALEADKATRAAISAESVPGDAEGNDTPEPKTRAPRTVGPKRTGSGAVSKATIRKIYERACDKSNEEFDNALSDGERKLVGWMLGKITTEQLAIDVPGITVLLGIGPIAPASPDEAPAVEIENLDEDDTVASVSDDEPADLVDATEDAA
jgi:hypothetical protein